MGSPTIFSGKYTKLLTQRGLMQQGGAVNQYDGQRNYIKNSSFENATADGWNRVKTTITNNLPSGTPTIGKLVSVAPSISSFGAFSGSAPFDTFALRFGNILSTVVAGEGVISDAFTVDPGDRGKVLTFKLYYQSDLGASTDNWSGVLGSQTWAVYIYDQTAGAWLQPTGFLGMNQNSGVGVVSGTFQSSVVAGQQYRIAVIALRNTTSTSALQIDDVYVGPQTAPIGPVVTDWVSYTPTGSWTANATYSGRWRRVGDSIEIQARVLATGTPNAIDLQVNLPTGYSIDTSKMPSTDFLSSIYGSAHGYDASTTAHYNLQVGYTTTGAFFTYQNQLTGQVISVTNATPFAVANGDVFHCTFKVPVVGWSSSVQMSNDTDTRVVAFQAYNAGGTATSVPTGATATKIVNLTAISDTHATWNAGSQAYIIPVSGYYEITSSVYTSAFSGGNSVGFILNGSYNETGASQQSSSIAPITVWGSRTVQLKAGDSVSIGYCQFSGTTQSVGAFPPTSLKITRLSGPSVVAASETVAMRATKFSGAHTSTGNPQNVTSWNSVSQDTHQIFNATSGVATIPVSGTYFVNAFVGFSANSSGTRAISIVRNGVDVIQSNIYISFPERAKMIASTVIKCNAGDSILISAFQNSGGTLNYDSLSASAFELVRVGN